MPKILKEQVQFELLNAIPEDGGEISASEARSKINAQLKRDVTQDEFTAAQEILIAKNKVLRGRRGIRAVLSKRTDVSRTNESTSEREMEGDVESFLHLHFVPDIIDPIPKTVEFLVQNTARGGAVAGLWTRPDITLAIVSRYPFQPIPELELYGFELKRPEGCTVYAVHEALAHTAFVHYSTVVIFLPEGHTCERNLPRMKEQALEHGVGIIRLQELKDTENYELLVDARKKNPPAWAINEFIETRFDEPQKHRLIDWLRL